MPNYNLTRRARRRAGRQRNVLLIVTALIAGAVVLAVVTRGNGAADGGGLGPTVVAEPRDLATTLEASGSLQRSDEQTVAYAAALPSDEGNGGEGDGGNDDGGGGGNGDSGAGDSGNGDSGNGDMTPAAFLTGPSGTSSSSTSSTSSTTSTTNPCSPTSSSSTTSSSSSTTSTNPCPTTTSTTSTTTSTTSTTSTTTPPTSTTTQAPGTSPQSTVDPRATGGTGDGGSSPGAATPAGGGGTDQPSGGDGADGASGDGGSGEASSAILTSVLDVGATVDRGTVLYTADDEPVVALIGEVPAWRTLEQGVDDGVDVRQLEENLAALGYGDLDVDESFTADTAAAVEAWETDLGRTAPDGVVTLGEVVFLSERGDVLGHEASVGDTLEAGSPVMTIGSEQRVVVADVDATEAGGWTPGSTVELEWADGTTSQGTVVGTGREVSDGEVELTVAIGADDTGAGQRRSGAEATVSLVDARRDGVVAVPVSAIVDDGGSPAVRVAQPDGPDNIVPVQIGLVADGWIEITAGLDGGEEVRLPG
jgi:Putative peptidoglycan binding domain